MVFLWRCKTWKLCCRCLSFFINQEHYFYLKLNTGSSTNTKAELLALCFLLKFGIATGLPTLKIYGDSYVIIN